MYKYMTQNMMTSLINMYFRQYLYKDRPLNKQ